MELHRLQSPDKKVAAVLIREDGGGAAGTRTLYLYLIDTADDQDLKKPVLVATACDDLALVWSDARTLEIGYKPRCDIRQFTNRWWLPPPKTDPERIDAVEMVLRRGSQGIGRQ